MVETATIVQVLPRRVGIESDLSGARHVMVQHEGREPFQFATFFYGYGYTDNSSTLSAATACAVRIGAAEPVEQRHRAPADMLDNLRRGGPR
jgi:hypothetical protein